jgi:hypothetical protein
MSEATEAIMKTASGTVHGGQFTGERLYIHKRMAAENRIHMAAMETMLAAALAAVSQKIAASLSRRKSRAARISVNRVKGCFGGNRPLPRLAGDLRDEIEVLVAVKNRQNVPLRDGCNEQIRSETSVVLCMRQYAMRHSRIHTWHDRNVAQGESRAPRYNSACLQRSRFGSD